MTSWTATADGIPFIQARNYRPAKRRVVDLVVLHSMENAEKPGSAEAVAAWFASAQAPMASAHFCCDSDGVVQCVHESDIAWAAPGANLTGIHVEHAGYARQTREQWLDEYGMKMLARSAALVAHICTRWEIPFNVLDAAGLLAGRRGITTHNAVTHACIEANKAHMTDSPYYNTKNPHKPKTDHTDPGPGFPMDAYLAMVQAAGLVV